MTKDYNLPPSINKEDWKSFCAFFDVLKNNVSKEEHFNWYAHVEVFNHLLKYLKDSNMNWNDIFLMGHGLVELSYLEAISSLQNKEKNTNFLKVSLEGLRLDNKKNSSYGRDMMLLVSAYHGRPLTEIKPDLSKSRLISPNLRKRFDLLVNCDFSCSYCGKSPPEVKLELEHIIPRSKGGTDAIGNLTVACFECNRGKRNNTLEEIKKVYKDG